MATDVLLVVHLPFSVEAEIPELLFKEVTTSAIPRINEWVIFLDDYLPVTRIFYSADYKPELHFDEVSYIMSGDFIPEVASDLNDALQLAGFSGTSPWAA